jgi:hypothetical protein
MIEPITSPPRRAADIQPTRAPARTHRPRPHLRRGGQLRQHAQSLCQRLGAFFRLVSALEPDAPFSRSTNRRPLHHRSYVRHRRTWYEGQLCVNHRTAAVRTHLELHATRHADRSKGSLSLSRHYSLPAPKPVSSLSLDCPKKLLDNASGYKPVVFLWNLWTFSAINTTGEVNRSTLALGDNLFCPI